MELDPRTSPHLSEDQVERYVDKRLSNEEFVACSSHLPGCDDCSRRVRNLRAATDPNHSRQLIEIIGGHPSADLISRFVDRETTAREFREVGEHLTICSRCENEVTLLREFQKEVAKTPVNPELVALVAASAPSFSARAPRKAPAWRYPALSLATGIVGALLAYIGLSPKLNDAGALREQKVASATRMKEQEQEILAARNRAASAEAKADAALRIQRQQSEAVRLAQARERKALADRTEMARQVAEAKAQLRRGATPGPGKPPVPVPFQMASLEAGITPPPNRLSPPTAIQIMGGGGTAAGGRLMTPVTTWVLERQPVLEWDADPEAISYLVTLLEDKEGERKQVFRSEVTKPVLKTPTPLKRGSLYVWQIEARRRDGESVPSTTAYFRIADDRRAAEVARAISVTAISDARVFLRAGMLDASEEVLKRLSDRIKPTPATDVEIKRLRSQIEKRRKGTRPE